MQEEKNKSMKGIKGIKPGCFFGGGFRVSARLLLSVSGAASFALARSLACRPMKLKSQLFALLCSAYPQVKVMVRVCPVSQSDATESSSFLKVDPRKKQITIMDPSANQTPGTPSQKRAAANQVPPKMFNFDAAFPPDASQVNE